MGVLGLSVPTQARVKWRNIHSFAIRPHTTATSDPSHWTLKKKKKEKVQHAVLWRSVLDVMRGRCIKQVILQEE